MRGRMFKKTGKSKEEKRRRREKEESNKKNWQNKHLYDRIQDSLQRFDENMNLKKEQT